MSYTLAEAAAACGLDKSTVRRAVLSGRISGTRNDLGVWHVEPAELHRVFPPVPHTEDDTTAVTREAPLETAGNTTTDILVAELRATIDDLRRGRDRPSLTYGPIAITGGRHQQRLLPAPEPRHSSAPTTSTASGSTGGRV